MKVKIFKIIMIIFVWITVLGIATTLYLVTRNDAICVGINILMASAAVLYSGRIWRMNLSKTQ